MARAIDADELEMFPYSEGAGTEEQISEWIEQTGLSEDDTASRARDLCWKVIDGFINVVKTQPTFTHLNEPERAGLYGKYTVLKNEDGSPVTNCFVLRPAEDPAAVAALRAYAATTDNAELADDIINWVGAEPTEPLELEELRDMNVNAGKIIDTVNAMPGFNQLDDMLTCESCIYFDAAVAPCTHCIRSTSSEDFYCSSKTASINDAEDTNNVKID